MFGVLPRSMQAWTLYHNTPQADEVPAKSDVYIGTRGARGIKKSQVGPWPESVWTSCLSNERRGFLSSTPYTSFTFPSFNHLPLPPSCQTKSESSPRFLSNSFGRVIRYVSPLILCEILSSTVTDVLCCNSSWLVARSHRRKVIWMLGCFFNDELTFCGLFCFVRIHADLSCSGCRFCGHGVHWVLC